MTCKDCVHYELCKYNTYQEAHYFGKDKEIYITIDNNTPCKFFKNKADFVEVKQGRWETRNFIIFDSEKVGYRCTECKTTWDTETNYCPHCGADMRKEGADNGKVC